MKEDKLEEMVKGLSPKRVTELKTLIKEWLNENKMGLGPLSLNELIRQACLEAYSERLKGNRG